VVMSPCRSLRDGGEFWYEKDDVEENEGLMLPIKPAVFRQAKWREQGHWIC
jgi:hypothetical protein